MIMSTSCGGGCRCIDTAGTSVAAGAVCTAGMAVGGN